MAGDAALRLLIDITARDSASSVVRSLIGVFTGLQGGIKGVVSAALQLTGLLTLVAGAIAIGIGVAAVKAAGDFQQGLMRLVTGAGDVTDNMQKMGQAILGISVATGVLTGPLLQAMYQIISAGQRGAQAENTLAVAARGAVVEQANVVDVAKALTTAMTDYGTKTFNATQFMNGYTRAVQLGKITLEELSTTMGPILPLAKNLGISFADVAGAMATMTNAGIPAARAATSLRFLFQSLENPTAKAEKAMKSFGLSSVALGNELKKSLPGALQMVYDAAKKAGPEGSVPFNRAVSDMIGGQRSLQAYLALTGTHMKTFAANTKAISAAMLGSKTAVLGWDVAQKNFNVQMSRTHAALQAVLIAIGLQLLPYVTRLAAAIVPVVAGFAAWFTHSNALQGVLTAVGQAVAFIAPAVMTVVGALTAFAGWVVKIIASLHLQNEALIVLKGLAILVGVALLLMLAPFIVLAVAVVAIIVGIMLAIRYLVIAFNAVKAAGGAAWEWIKTAAMNTWNWIKTAWGNIGAFFTGVWASIKSTATAAWNGLTAFLKGVWETIKGIFKGAVDAIVNSFKWLYDHNYYVKDAVDAIVNFTKSAVAWLKTAWQNTVAWIGARWHDMVGLATSAWNGVKGVFNAVVGWVGNILSSVWNSISRWWSSTASNSQKSASDLWSRVKGVFASAWGMISGPLSSLAGSIGNFFSGLANRALSWGANIIGGIISGISSKLGALAGIVGQAAATVARILGFHSPPQEGPARDADTWAPNFIKMYTAGLLAGIPQLSRAASQVASTLGSPLSATSSGWSTTRAGSWSTGSGQVVVNQITIQPPSIQLDGREVTERISRRQAKETRIQGNVRNR